ncbi:GNAT family N-acetyltransferase [Priestia megaterium]|uniref:GNAT family N-acetyltransferase n=1 Tax=Priestia megaterium TaxID=1404 RepID=UPI002E223AF9
MKGKLNKNEKVQISYYDAMGITEQFNIVSESPDSIFINGFTYFSTLDIGVQGNSNGYEFIIASKDKEILGLLLFARLNEEQNPCKECGTLNLFYIDVREDIRNKGIAKHLFAGWAKYLEDAGNKKEFIQLSSETILGKQAKIHLIAKKALINHIIF